MILIRSNPKHWDGRRRRWISTDEGMAAIVDIKLRLVDRIIELLGGAESVSAQILSSYLVCNSVNEAAAQCSMPRGTFIRKLRRVIVEAQKLAADDLECVELGAYVGWK